MLRNKGQEKNVPLIPRDFVDPIWLENHPDQDTASRISNSYPAYEWPDQMADEPEDHDARTNQNH